MARETYRTRLTKYAANPDEFLTLNYDPPGRHQLAQDIGDALDEEKRWPPAARMAILGLAVVSGAELWALAIVGLQLAATR